MTPRTNARIAGFSFLVYIASGISSLLLRSNERADAVLVLVMSCCALLLGVTLYSITRRVDSDVALIGLVSRALEAGPGSGEIYFAVGSAAFCWLLLRGRMIPVPLAGLGCIASVLLVILLPLQTAGLFGGPGSWSSPVTWAVWAPMLVFEVALALWFIIRGVAAPVAATPA